MKNTHNFRNFQLVFVVLIGLCLACDDDCDDCLDLASKNILVVDASGTNLLFGDGAVYNPENVTVRSSDEELQPVVVDESTGTLQFFLTQDIMEYSVFLSESEVETLGFELAERRSERCCGMQTFSTVTRINGTETDNADVITIIK